MTQVGKRGIINKAVTFNGAAYYFLRNLQGDVIAITNADGDVIARYTYDAWGKILSVTDNAGNAITDASNIALVNPYRYRSYYYDTETSLYYLNSRYYNPEVGRFINADEVEVIFLTFAIEDILGYNLFNYCSNYPVNDCDYEGYISAKKLANKLSTLTVFNMFLSSLMASYTKGLVAIGGYATKIVTPIALKSFWWKPWAALAVIVAAVAIVVASVGALYASRKDEINRAKNMIPNKLMNGNRVDLSKFNNPNGPKTPRGGRGILGPLGWYILKDANNHRGSVWKLFNKAGERIASLLSDGTITGK